MQDKLIIAGLLIAIGFASGLGSGLYGSYLYHSKVRADLAICKSNTTNLMEAIQSQNRKVLDLKDESEKRKEASEAALKAAEGEIKRLKQSSAYIANRTGETCEDAEKLINEALGL